MREQVKTAWARAVRTFIRLAGAPILAAAAVNWLSSESAKLGVNRLGLGLIAAVVGAGLAFLLGLTPQAPTTSALKALAEFIQAIVAGFSTWAVAGTISETVASLGAIAPGVLLTAIASAVVCFVQNSAEENAPPPSNPPE